MEKPAQRPQNPSFSSGPCPKFPGWSFDALKNAALARMHRSKPGLSRIQEILALTKEVHKIPQDYHIAMVPGSATGAIEMALWSLLGARPVDILAWDAFGMRWKYDIEEQLKLPNLRSFEASAYGEIADLSKACPDHDIVFNWNGSSSGVCTPHGDWISKDRTGLVICDATSAAFAMELPWEKLDVTIFSWQKGLGGEAAHGMIVLNDRAVERLKTYDPPWPIPWIFGLKRFGKFHEGLFKGLTNNTPSLLCIEDFLQGLHWAKRMGGLEALVARSKENFQILSDWVEKTPWIDFAVRDPRVRSHTTVCLQVVDPRVQALSEENHWAWLLKFSDDLEEEQAVYDIKNHKFAPPSLRIWCGPTLETADMRALIPWLEWAFQKNVENL